MIGALRGYPTILSDSTILLFAGDVGYKVYVPNTMIDKIDPSKVLSLSIHTHVRDDALDLFGFETYEDLQLFELLLTVSGIGPKTALAVLNKGAEAIRKAVQNNDVVFFTTVPRLGKKNAQKIIIDLKNKLGSVSDLQLPTDVSGETKDLIDALLSMGFSKHDVTRAIQQLPPECETVEQKIRLALVYLGKI